MLPSSAALKLPDMKHRTSERVQHVIPVSVSWGWPLNLFIFNLNSTTWMMPHHKRTRQAPYTKHRKRRQRNKQDTRFQWKQHAIRSPRTFMPCKLNPVQFSPLGCTEVPVYNRLQLPPWRLALQNRTMHRPEDKDRCEALRQLVCVHKTDNRCRIIKARPSPLSVNRNLIRSTQSELMLCCWFSTACKPPI